MVNISMVFRDSTPDEKNAIMKDFQDLIENYDCSIIVAAGNDANEGHPNVDTWPGLARQYLNEIILVEAVDIAGHRTPYSQRAAFVDIAATGSLYPVSNFGVAVASGTGNTRSDWHRRAGTSFAVPQVAGIVAYFLWQWPQLRNTKGRVAINVKNHLLNVAYPKGNVPKVVWNGVRPPIRQDCPPSQRPAMFRKREAPACELNQLPSAHADVAPREPQHCPSCVLTAPPPNIINGLVVPLTGGVRQKIQIPYFENDPNGTNASTTTSAATILPSSNNPTSSATRIVSSPRSSSSKNLPPSSSIPSPPQEACKTTFFYPFLRSKKRHTVPLPSPSSPAFTAAIKYICTPSKVVQIRAPGPKDALLISFPSTYPTTQALGAKNFDLMLQWSASPACSSRPPPRIEASSRDEPDEWCASSFSELVGACGRGGGAGETGCAIFGIQGWAEGLEGRKCHLVVHKPSGRFAEPTFSCKCDDGTAPEPANDGTELRCPDEE